MNRPNQFLSLLVLLLITTFSCEQSDSLIVKCDTPALIIGQEDVEQICGGHFLIVDLIGSDTLRIQYNAVLRDFFQINNYDEDDLPLPIYMEYANLQKGDACKNSLQKLVCIQSRSVQEDWNQL